MKNKDDTIQRAVSPAKYPILLVHGMGVRDMKRVRTWGRIPELLRAHGYRVYQGGQDANGSVEDNAEALKRRILEITKESGFEKVNILAHSKGGLDARYMITHLEMADKVASLTTFATPHHGSKTVDIFFKLPHILLKAGSKVTDLIYRIAGDQSPKTYECICLFCTANAESFNQATPDDGRVYYQSYAFYMKHWYSDLIMLLPYLVVYAFEGRNDGLVVPRSAKWSNFRGAFCGNTSRGISHYDEMDFRRCRFTKRIGKGIDDIAAFYLHVANELAEKEF